MTRKQADLFFEKPPLGGMPKMAKSGVGTPICPTCGQALTASAPQVQEGCVKVDWTCSDHGDQITVSTAKGAGSGAITGR